MGTLARTGTLHVSMLALALVASFETAHAAPPGPCNLNDPNAQNTLGPNQEAFYRSLAGNQYFTNAGNTISVTSNASGGTSIGSAEASTAVISELMAERRVREAIACPAGYEKVEGVCRPVRPRLSSGHRSKPKPSSSPSSTLSRDRAAQPSTQFSPEAQPELFRQNSVWSEARYDYEKRTGLGTPGAPASRTQSTVELLVGGDRTFQSGSTQLIIGGLGSLSSIKQQFNTVQNEVRDTPFHVDIPSFDPNTGDPITVPYDYLLPASHRINTQQEQTLKGFGGGLTASISRDGFFADGLFKADFFTLNRTTVSSDAFPRRLEAWFNQPSQANPGCINVGYPMPPGSGGFSDTLFATPYSLTDIQNSASPMRQASTTAVNFVISENIGYHFATGPISWAEPFVGGSFTYSAYGSNAAALGLRDGQDLRLQAGIRLGVTTALADTGILSASFAQVIYSDVYINGFVTNSDGFSAGFLLADQGKLRFQSIATARLLLPNGFSFYLQAQGRWGDDYLGYGGRGGIRYEY